jgi:hypothetical protein
MFAQHLLKTFMAVSHYCPIMTGDRSQMADSKQTTANYFCNVLGNNTREKKHTHQETTK